MADTPTIKPCGNRSVRRPHGLMVGAEDAMILACCIHFGEPEDPCPPVSHVGDWGCLSSSPHPSDQFRHSAQCLRGIAVGDAALLPSVPFSEQS